MHIKMTLQDNRLARTELWYAGLSCPKSNRMKSVGGCWYMLLATVIHYFAASRAAGRRGPCRAKAIPWTVGFPKPHSFRQKNGWPPAWADRRRWRGAMGRRHRHGSALPAILFGSFT